MRHPEVASALREAVAARVAKGAPSPAALALLEARVGEAIEDPAGLLVSEQKMWEDAERIFGHDQNLAAMIYQWIFFADPTEYRALVYVGDAFFADLHFEQAIKYYELARELAPGRPIPLARVADVFTKCKRQERALPLYEAAITATQPVRPS